MLPAFGHAINVLGTRMFNFYERHGKLAVANAVVFAVLTVGRTALFGSA